MSETKQSYFGHGFCKKVISWLIIMAMMIGLVPADLTLIAKAEEATEIIPEITIWFEQPNDWSGTPLLQMFNTGAKVTESDGTEVVWKKQDGTGGTTLNKFKQSAGGTYYVKVKCNNWDGFQVVNGDEPGNEAKRAKVSKYDGDHLVYTDGSQEGFLDTESQKADIQILGAIQALEDGDEIYYSNGIWYEGKGTSKVLKAEPKKVKFHFINTYNWLTPIMNAWETTFVTVSGHTDTAQVINWTTQKEPNTTKYPVMKKGANQENGYDWYSLDVEIIGAVTGLQIVDADSQNGDYVKLTKEQLDILKNTTASDVYLGLDKDGNVLLTENKSEIVVPTVPVEKTTPTYEEDGTITFSLETNKSIMSAHVRGTFTSWEVNEITMNRAEDEEGNVTFSVNTEVPTKGGLYRYGMYTGTNTYAGDLYNSTKYKGTPVIVRNPEIGNGTVTIYYPYKGTLGNNSVVLYRELGSSDEFEKEQFMLVDDEGAENLYSVEIPASKLTVGKEYEYKIQINGKDAISDPYNFASRIVNKTTLEVISTTFTPVAKVTEPAFESPVLGEDQRTVTFNYFAPNADEVKLAGSMYGTNWYAEAKKMTKGENGVWSISEELTLGVEYQYKFLVDGEDFADPKNENVNEEGNSVYKMAASYVGEESPIVDAEAETITFNFNPDNYGLKGKVKTVTLMGTVVGEEGWETGKNLSRTEDGNFTVTLENVEPGTYQYKFKVTPVVGIELANKGYYADVQNENVVPADQEGAGNSVVIMPGLNIVGKNAAGAGTFKYTAEGTADEGSIKFSLKSEKPGFNMTEDGVLTVANTADTGYYEVVLDYTVNNNPKQKVQKYYYTQRALIYEYEYKKGSKYTGVSDIYTWNNASYVTSYDLINYGTTKEPKYVAYINADKNTSSFGYIVRLFGYWGPDQNTDREYGDRTLTMNEGDRYTKVRGGEGVEEPYVLPSGQSYYDNGIVFCYRDDDKFYNGTMDTIEEAEVVIKNVETGKEETHKMEYVEKDELFIYKFQGIPDGDYEYHFLVDGEKVTDQYNPSGIKHYEKAELEIKTTVTPDEANYDQNPVVEVKATNEANGKNVELSKITADLTSIAGKEMCVNFSTVTNKGVIYIDSSIKAGTYDLPITVTDLYGNTTETSVKIKVVNKTTVDASWDEARIYFMLTDRFADGDSSNNGDEEYNLKMAESFHGGDIKGVISKLAYLQQLGINTIWITPIVDNIDTIVNDELNQAAYTGYWANDFTKLDEHLGTTEDLDTLLDEAHKRGIKVMVDIVINHAGYGTETNDNFVGMLRKDSEVGPDDITMELSGMPDFKTEEQDVRAKLIAWQTAWASHTTANGNSIDYFRVDTIKHVEHETFSQLKTALAEVNPNFKMIGEYWGAAYNATANYLGNGQMDSMLDFDFKDVAAKFVNGNIETAEKTLEARNAVLNSTLTMGQFLSSHDEDGFLYSVGYDYGKAKLAASLQITAKGQPVVYYGEEVALSGKNEFGVYENNRYDMQFDNLNAKQKDMLAHYRKVLAARSLYSDVISRGTRTNVLGGDGYAYEVVLREYNGETVYLAFNTNDTAKKVTIELTGTDKEAQSMKDLYSGDSLSVSDGKVEVTIPAMSDGGTAIIAKDKALTGIEVIAPTKTEYEIGEELDLTNLTVTGIYSKDKAPILEDAYTVDSSAYKKDIPGEYKIKVSYDIYEEEFTVKVKPAPTDVPTATPEPTATSTPMPTATSTPMPTATSTPMPTATSTPIPTATSTPIPTATNTPIPTATPEPTATPAPTVVTPDVPIATVTVTPKPTKVPTKAPTKVPTKAPTATVAPSYVKVKSIKLNAKKATLGNKASITLTATVNPTDAKYKTVTWKSSNSKVVKVTKKGKLTAKKVTKKTTVIITATVKDGKTAKCKVTVLPGPSYKVNYKLAGGKNNGLNPTYLAKNQKLKLKDPTRKKYTFEGWYVNGKKVKTLSKKVTNNKKVTVKATWKKVKVDKAVIKNAKNSSKSTITVKFAKVKGIDGYDIFCSTKKGFNKSATTTVTAKKSKTSAKIKKLTKGTTYYVRVKAYKLDSTGNKVYGKASKTIKVKINK